MNSSPNSTPNSGIRPEPSSWFTTSGFVSQFNEQNNAEGLNLGNNENRGGIINFLSELRKRLRPWSTEFFRITKYGWPLSIATVPLRIKHNLEYFLTNYLCLSVILMVKKYRNKF